MLAEHPLDVTASDRTSFLSVVVKSSYPAHVKLWLQHASPAALARMCAQLGADEYGAVAASFEVPPDERV